MLHLSLVSGFWKPLEQIQGIGITRVLARSYEAVRGAMPSVYRAALMASVRTARTVLPRADEGQGGDAHIALVRAGWVGNKPTKGLSGTTAIAAASSAAAEPCARAKRWLGGKAVGKCNAQVRNAKGPHASWAQRTAAGSYLTALASTRRQPARLEVAVQPSVVHQALDTLFPIRRPTGTW